MAHGRDGYKYECDWCDTGFNDSTDAIVEPRQKICPDCAEYSYTCENCGHHFDGDNWRMVATQDDTVFCCEGCASQDDYVVCDDCGEWFPDDEGLHNRWPEQHYCDGCSQDYFTCTDCDYVTHIDDLYYDEAYGDPYCQNCYCENGHANSGRIREYGYSPAVEFYGVDVLHPTKKFFGVELEIEVPRSETPGDISLQMPEEGFFWYTEDSSLDHGFEITTQPATLDFHLHSDEWETVIEAARDCECTSHDAGSCGLHIHVSADAFSGDQHKMRLAYFVHTQQDLMEQVARREASGWAKYKNKEINEDPYNNDRYEAVNFRPRRTVEFRLFRGTLNINTLKASIEFTDAVVEFTRAAKNETLLSHGKARAAFWGYIAKSDYQYLPDYLDRRGLGYC